jgi:hypothetical protein
VLQSVTRNEKQRILQQVRQRRRAYGGIQVNDQAYQMTVIFRMMIFSQELPAMEDWSTTGQHMMLWTLKMTFQKIQYRKIVI